MHCRLFLHRLNRRYQSITGPAQLIVPLVLIALLLYHGLEAPYLAIGVACLAAALTLLIVVLGLHFRKEKIERRRFRERCSGWACPHCGEQYGPRSQFIGCARRPDSDESYQPYAIAICAHCDRRNCFDEEGTRLFDLDEPYEEGWTPTAAKETDAKEEERQDLQD